METTLTQVKTAFIKGYTGSYCESNVTSSTPGKIWHVHTSKSSNGHVRCYAQHGEIAPGGGFSFMMFEDKSITLCSEKKQGNEKNIRAIHALGLQELFTTHKDLIA